MGKVSLPFEEDREIVIPQYQSALWHIAQKDQWWV